MSLILVSALRLSIRQLSQSMLGSMPPGALVMEVESSGAASKAGIHVFDIIEGIGGHKIHSVDDLRQTIRKLGAGKTQFILRRPNGQRPSQSIALNASRNEHRKGRDSRRTRGVPNKFTVEAVLNISSRFLYSLA